MKVDSTMKGFSLVIATRNRPDELARLLNSLRNQTFKDFEVILVDQSIDSSSVFVEEMVKTSGLCAVYLRDAGKGLSRARNIGLEKASGKILAFPDDDCWYPPDLLERVSKVFEQDSDLTLLSGTYSEPGRWNPRFPKRPGCLNLWNMFARISSVTIFLRAEVLGKVRFDEGIGVGTDLPAGEEMDLVIQVLAQGHKGIYDPSIVVYHKIERAANTLPESILQREKADAYVLMRNAMRYRAFWLWLRLVARTGKGLIRAMRSDWERRVFKARLEGYRLALGGGRHGD